MNKRSNKELLLNKTEVDSHSELDSPIWGKKDSKALVFYFFAALISLFAIGLLVNKFLL